MKTKNILTALTFALIFTGISASYAAKVNTGREIKSSVNYVMYDVNVHFAADEPICNSYIVKVTDGNGNLVAPPKVFVPGISKYYFKETGSVKGVRTVSLVADPNLDRFACSIELFTRPDVLVIEKQSRSGMTYSFDLFPTIRKQGILNPLPAKNVE